MPALQAYQRACRNLYPIPRYNDHTITEAINAKYGQVRGLAWDMRPVPINRPVLSTTRPAMA